MYGSRLYGGVDAAAISSSNISGTDSVSLVDATTKTLAEARSPNENISISDSARIVSIFSKSASDAISVADVVYTLYGFPRNSSDSIAISDAATIGPRGYSKASNDSLSISDALTQIIKRNSAAPDSLTISDTALQTSIHALSRSGSDSLAIADTATRLSTSVRTSNDSFLFVDAITFSSGLGKASSESIIISDNMAVLRHVALSINDSITFSDVLARGMTSAAGDGFLVYDAANPIITKWSVAGSDAFSVFDSATQTAHIVSSLITASADAFSIGEGRIYATVVNIIVATPIRNPPTYEFILCESPSVYNPFAPFVKIGSLISAKSRQFTLLRNRAGSASFSLRTNDPLLPHILDNVNLNDVRGTVRKCIRIRRNGVDLWSGPIWGIQGGLAEGTITFSCVGWMEELQHRILWQTADYSNGGAGTAADTIAFSLLGLVGQQDPAHPLLVRPGTVTGNVGRYPRNRYYVRGQNLGQAIQELSDIEAGFDYEVDPVTRGMNLYAWDSYRDRTDIKLGYHLGAKNLKDIQWREDADKTCNYMVVQSLGAPISPVYDSNSQDQYGLFEENVMLTGANQDILTPYAVAELAIRSRPLVTYTLTPQPGGYGGGPTLFDDYQIGDKVYFSAQKDYFRILNQAVRVFGASVTLDDNGNEIINELQTAPA